MITRTQLESAMIVAGWVIVSDIRSPLILANATS
jgi:hypothetical protein